VSHIGFHHTVNSILSSPPLRWPQQRGGNAGFHIPLCKDDLLLSLNIHFVKVWLEVCFNEEMAPPKGGLRRNMSAVGMKMLGVSTNRLIGWGWVDLMPLLLGTWEEVWKNDS
jgi:hypothetical protein